MSSKGKLITVILVLVVIALGFYVFVYQGVNDDGEVVKTETKVTSGTVCTDSDENRELLTKSAVILLSDNQKKPQPKTEFSKDDVKKLGDIASKMEEITGSDRDPNCLFVITKYYIVAEDGEKARENYDKLTKAYNQNEGYSDLLSIVARSPESISEDVDSLGN